MGAADLHHISVSLGLLIQGTTKVPYGGDEALPNDCHGRDIHRSGERVVRGLRHVHMVIGMNRRLGAKYPPRHLNGTV